MTAKSTADPRSTRLLLSPRALLVCSLAALLAAPVDAQEPDIELSPGEELYEIRLIDGSVLIGRVLSVSGDRIVVTTAGGARVELVRSQIREARTAEGRVVRGEFWQEDPNLSRLFFTSTGRALEAGRTYLGTYLIVLPFVAVGATDWLTLGVGAPVLFGEFEPFYLAPKVQIVDTDRVALAAGALHFLFRNDGSDVDEDVGILYGVGTFGDDDRALTLGVGFGYAGSDFSSQPVGMIGGEVRASRRIKWLTENYFLPGETGAAFSGGVRLLGERFSADVGIAAVAEEGDVWCCLPLLGVAYAFGGRR